MSEKPFLFDGFDGVTRSIAMPVASSLGSLRKPDLPGRKDRQYVSSNVAELLRKYNVKPGIYSKWDEVEIFLIAIHDDLIALLIKNLRDVDVFDLSKKLYDTLENLYGLFELRQLHSTPDILLRGRASASTELFEDWKTLSQYTLAIRYLIEMALKHCPQSSLCTGRSKTMHLIGLSMEIVCLDFFMDHVCCDAIPHELIVNEKLESNINPSNRATEALTRWKHDAEPHMFKKQEDKLSGKSRLLFQPVQEEELTDTITWKHFELPMKNELGYSLTDWLHFNKGVITFFGERERLKVISKTKLLRHLEQNTGLQKETIGLLLEDRIVSPLIFKSTTVTNMLPSENFWRDLRLTNRPIIELDLNGKPIILIGIETFSKGTEIVLNRLMEGKMHFSRAQSGGPIETAVGALYTNIGNYFRDTIISKCRERGFEVISEKACAGTLGLPDGIGPVDVFVVDYQRRRFVLGEAKDISGVLEPTEIKKQRNYFLGSNASDGSAKSKCFLSKLKNQERWFRENMLLLQDEFAIDASEGWTIEGVIIVNSPLLWVYLHKEPLPIMDDLQFFYRLAEGKQLLIEVP